MQGKSEILDNIYNLSPFTTEVSVPDSAKLFIVVENEIVLIQLATHFNLELLM